MLESLIFDIKRYAINDGPGIRIVVFFKGCNLQCAWCHNPESISGSKEKMYSPVKCIRCGSCVEACPENALAFTDDGLVTNKDLCVLCGKCAEVCPTKAMEMSGKSRSVGEIMEIIEKERVFFDQSGGGVTFSGGEPLLHTKILFEILDECGKKGIHRAIDTAGNVKTETLLEAAKRTDLFLYDLKMMDSDLHFEWTKVKNEKILHNLEVLSTAGAKIIIRIPLIAGVNDTDENLSKTAKFISELEGERKEVHLLPYHNIALNKYLKLGKENLLDAFKAPGNETLANAIMKFSEFGIKATVGG
ncbi:MAG: glycyl-radical enzyme activating protein [Bacteroidetes bacterium HGW-Bacteroidetes-1]|jgi:pyruvate formate lyase activating enzyme|nr:MAG: glycyl-radical enzyme activating protein [Bacteroidetes bacterium HGW-Bacteroidetes-1]